MAEMSHSGGHLESFKQEEESQELKKFIDRWILYSKYRGVCHPFVPFKAPLSQSINALLDPHERFTPQNVMKAFPSIGLVIDLTGFRNPAKYYSPQEFTSQGVGHFKLSLPGIAYVTGGKNRVPMSEETVNIFITEVNKFLKENPDKLIGVHCTHGLNRTGYLICRYFIQENKMTAKNAIEAFETARDHQMVHEWARDHLYKVANQGGDE